MDLWIRSQNKRTLKKVDDLYINLLGCLAKEDELYWITDKNIKLGGYKTEERALEVLDEIEKFIKQPMQYESRISYMNGTDMFTRRIYHMPQE